jgi:glycosyltransferase involved in cell wall biosynthesis
MPATAIITRTVGRPLLLARAAESVTRQTCRDFLWVVVNDGGDPREVDRAIAPCLPALEGRILRVDHPRSLGRTAASNAGIRASDSRYLVFHDDDDTWEPAFLARATAALAARANPQFRAAVSYATAIHERIEDGRILEVARHALNSDLRELKLVDFLRENRTPNLSFLYERAVHEDLGPYDESLDALEDWEFLLRFYRRFEAILVREPLANYHFRPGSAGQCANSATGDVDLHGLHHQMLWNRLLREDLDAGRFGLGALGAMVQTLDEDSRRLDYLADFAQLAMRARGDGHATAVVCGCGVPGRRAASAVRLTGLGLLGFTDRDPRLAGTQVEGLPVLSPEAGLRTGAACIIGSFNRAEEIAQDLRTLAGELGLPAPAIYLPGRFR